MNKAIVITPVKNALENTLKTIEAILANEQKVQYVVYNDFSDEHTSKTLAEKSVSMGFELINLADLTTSPSPNYNIVLAHAQNIALAQNLPLIVVESDVEIKKDTFTKLLDFMKGRQQLAMAGAVTVDNEGKVNFPYLKFSKHKQAFESTKRSLSFCCTLMSPSFLKAYSFANLDRSKDWYDTIISKKALELNFENYILLDTPVLHKAHGSRPWKQLKYSNPIKYYWYKFTKGRDKI